MASAREELATAEAELQERLQRLREIEARVSNLVAAREQLLRNRAAADADNDPAKLGALDRLLASIEEALADPDGPPQGLEVEIAPDGEVNATVDLTSAGSGVFKLIREANARGDIQVNTPSKDLNKKIREKLANPELGWYKIQNTAYKFSFLLIPISLPFVWLMFAWKKGVTLFDHAVFVLYSLSFMSLLFVAGTLLVQGPNWARETLAPLLSLAVPVHMYFQLKGAYHLGWFSALWRTVALLLAAFLSLLLFFFVILTLGVLG